MNSLSHQFLTLLMGGLIARKCSNPVPGLLISISFVSFLCRKIGFMGVFMAQLSHILLYKCPKFLKLK